MLPTPPPTSTGTLTTDDGVELFTQRWIPAESDTLRAAVALVHGHAEHSGRYAHVAGYLNQHAIAVYAYDQRGFGRSEGRRAYVASFDVLLDDLALFLDRVRTQMPDGPLFLFGHSMGGAVATLYVLERSDNFAGLILSSPAIEVDADVPSILRLLSDVISRILPILPTIHTPEDLLSRDSNVVDAAKNDPLNYHGRVLARTGAEMLQASRRIQRKMSTLALPFLILHGTADQLTDPGGSRALYSQARSSDKTLNLYPGLYHETFNEPEKEQVLNDIVEWLKART